MFARIFSAAVHGVEAVPVEIEANVGGGQPKIIIVGLPDTAVKESRDRVFTALGNAGFKWPRGRTTINLAPADLKKEGPSFDLPIALGIIAAQETLAEGEIEGFLFAGELALTGKVRGIKGALAIALEARRSGRKALIVPAENAKEAAVVEGLDVYGIHDLRQVAAFLRREILLDPVRTDTRALLAGNHAEEVDFSDIKGQQQVRRAVEVAVAGGHNILMIGPPGAGKSMISQRIPTIMPPMTLEEAIEATKIHSICGQLDRSRQFVIQRPFRSPHHTISDVGLLGGGTNPMPGEISLAHNGVLFLDELPEFRRSTLEVMRQPLEAGEVTISRAAGAMTFPASFMLVAAMNPCPCGYAGDPRRECRCAPGQIQRYRQKISGPLLDRIDLHVEVPSVSPQQLRSGESGESSEAIRERVRGARRVQYRRFQGVRGQRANARMSSRQLKNHSALSEECADLLQMAMSELQLSARAHDRIIKVARTIADLEKKEEIQPEHIAEAIQFRSLDRNLWV